MLRGQEIVKNRKEIIAELNRAAAAELQAAYRYLYLSHYATSMHGREVAERFAEMAKSEWEHTSTFLERIVQLGGVPFQKLSEVDKLSYARYLPPPKDPANWKQMLKDSLEAEREAIDFYHRLAGRLWGEDPVTAHLVRHALEDEIKDEHTLACLLD